MQGVYPSGSDNSPAIVMLHSSMSSARQWRALTALLEADYRVVNLDLFGYGEGPDAEDAGSFSLSTEARRVMQVLDELEIAHFHLLGHSYGGALALKLALEQNQRVTSLMLFEPVAFHLLDKDNPARQEVEGLASDMSRKAASEAAQAFVDYWNGAGYFAGLPQQMQALFSQQVNKLKLDFQALLGETYTPEKYAKIEQPVLLMTGKNSRQSAHAVAAVIAHQLPRLTARPVSGGHMAPITHAEEVNNLILEFLVQK
ncbi:alpha/beta fold hydrolase [Lacimicrobium alkaliphilum]|uniref:2-succinyl-6-hydroxy-2,4-cyclohexadiene-1-carboxylate synthase n=1 Tax=Lacimicrobium alkaliphilum TaxID=1526571 RepID=A0ABQ1R3P1_9ALTE|nr:alpha/beta hydrolase [Lacimicrobium alkaliphilum]GGD56114.1 putative 2-succinyl-6-hydroxy-2,4-cyclohexadiene-1-carboxylate synthase [Lacimicrobium alkaliphilum]